MPLVDVNELHKQFGENEVLRGVNLTVEEGDVVAVIGRSGSGKSTFLRILNGLETFDAGHGSDIPVRGHGRGRRHAPGSFRCRQAGP